MPAAIVLRQFGLGNLRAETCRWSLVRVTIQNSLRALRDGSILLALEILAHRVRQADFAEIFRRRIRLQGVSRTDLADLIDFVAAHRLEPVVDRVYDGLDLARQAIADSAGGGHFGSRIRLTDWARWLEGSKADR
jgi:D-arabinose 1-dehydrogenase-like Zn-dependent alcohol dehydrogenase